MSPAAPAAMQPAFVQVLRAMEVRGFVLDRQRYKALFAEMCRREEAARRHSDQPPGETDPAAYVQHPITEGLRPGASMAIVVGCATAISW